MKKVLFVATVDSHIKHFHIPYLQWFKEQEFEVHVATNGNEQIKFCDVKHIVPFERNPFKSKNIMAYKKLKNVIEKENFNIIHCNTPVGGVITRLAAINSRRNGTKVIYTAHGFHFYKGAPIFNWLLFYPIEKICAKWTDCLITINKEDHLLAQKKLKAKQIKYIPGLGIDISRYSCTHVDKQRSKYMLGLPQDAFMLFSVGELNKNKNHQVVIQALANIQDKNIHYCIAGKGILENELIILAEQLSVKEQVHLLGFRDDVIKLYHAADVFLLPSYREGLSVALMEAMAAGLPVICSKIRGNCDLVVEEKGGIFCEAGNIEEFVQSIKRVKRDLKLRQQWGEFNAKKIENFDIDIVKQMMLDVYNKY